MKNRSVADFAPGSMSVRQMVKAGWRLMTRREQRKALVIAAFAALAGVAELVSVMAVYPLVSVLIKPTTLQTNTKLAILWHFAGEPSTEVFVIGLTIIASFLVIAGMAASFFAQVTADGFAGACQERLGRDLLAAFFAAPYLWFVQRNPLLLGNLFLNHIVVWSRDYIRRLLMLANQIAAVLLPVIVLIAIAPLFGLAVLAVGASLVAILRLLVRNRTSKLLTAKRAADETAHVFLIEALQGIKDVKLSSREDAFLKVFAHTYHMSSRSMAASNSWNLIPVQIVMTLGQIGILAMALGLFLTGTDGANLAATMALVVLVGTRVVPAMNRFSAAATGLTNMKSWIEVLSAVHESLEHARASSPPTTAENVDEALNWNKLRLEGLAFGYPAGGDRVLRNINLVIKRAGSYAFVGPSGAGKSTIVDIILGLLAPTEGQILIDGIPLPEVGLRRWQKRIGYVPQTPLITDNSLKANVAFGVPEPKIDEAKVWACLKLANLDDVVTELPQGLDTPLGDRGHRFSGGQRQRVAIARALYNDPEILVLDEATSALDTVSERAIRDAMQNLHGRVTVISIAHRFSTIEDCDHIFLLEDGALVAEGTYHALVDKNPLFRRLAHLAAPIPANVERGVEPIAVADPSN
jgi:ATP-binding cassette, subfamily B, bacterial PglK